MWLAGTTVLIIHDPGRANSSTRGKTRVQLILQLVKLMKVSGESLGLQPTPSLDSKKCVIARQIN